MLGGDVGAAGFELDDEDESPEPAPDPDDEVSDEDVDAGVVAAVEEEELSDFFERLSVA